MSLAYTPPVWDEWPRDRLHAHAADPTAAPEVLRALWDWASFLDEDVLEILAANPSTPMELLLKLVHPYAVAVTQNPAFRLRMSTEPGFFARLDEAVLRSIGRARGIEPRLLYVLGEDRSRPFRVRAAVAGNPDCPADLMRSFVKHAFKVRDALARNPSLPDELLPVLARDRSADVRSCIARRPNLSPELRAQFSVDDHPAVRATIARRRDTTRATLVRMAEGEWAPEVLVEIIQKRRTPIESIAPLTRHRSCIVRSTIATWRPNARIHPLADRDPATGEIVGEAELRFKPRDQGWSNATRMVPDWVLGTIIDLGWQFSLDRLGLLEGYGFLNRTPGEMWPSIAKYLAEEELFALLRGMIVLEEMKRDEWFAGSVACTIFLARSMIQLYPHRGEEVRAYIKRHSKNRYLFSIRQTHAELTAEERVDYAAREMVRIAAHKEEQKRLEAEAARQAEIKLQEVRRRAHIRHEKSEQRARVHETLKCFAPADRLRRIIADTSVTLGYFSPEWGVVDDHVLDQLSRNELCTLRERTRLKSSRRWRAVGARLTEYLGLLPRH